MLSLILILTLPAAAQTKPPMVCVRKTPQGYEEPANLGALLACQEREAAALRESYRAAHNGSNPPESVLSSLAHRQRQQAAEYMKRNPKKLDDEGVAKLSRDIDEALAGSTLPEGGTAGRELDHLRSLQSALAKEASEGPGVTPGMAEKAREIVKEKQGGKASADFETTLESLQRAARDPVEQAKDQLDPRRVSPGQTERDDAHAKAIQELEESLGIEPGQ
ncbi:MAG: hypothetical protein WC943_06885 [Elusimicrobiota bacterium]|jgi:hypothetical protein